MDTDHLSRLHAQSTLGDLPSYDVALDWSSRGEELGSVFQRYPRLPGVVVADGDAVRGVISRGQYLRLIGRYLGHEVYHPRPIRHMFEAVEKLDHPLVLPTATPIHEAVGLALRRPRALIYEPLIVRDPTVARPEPRSAGFGPEAGSAADLRLVDFPDLLMADARISALRNVQMHQILATVREGFLLVDRDFTIAAEYSASIERIFQRRQLAGLPFVELLAAAFDAERAELGRDYVATLFDPNVIERLVADINPLRQAPARVAGRLLYLDFRFVRSFAGIGQASGGRVDRVLVRVDDVTREVELAQERAEQERRKTEQVDLTFAVLRLEPSRLDEFLRGCAAVEAALAGAGTPIDPAALARRVHGLKGEAGLAGLGPFQKLLHRLEDHLGAITGVGGAEARAALPGGVAALGELLAETRGLLARLRQLGGSGEPGKAVSAGPAPATLADELRQAVAELATRHHKSARLLCQFDDSGWPAPWRPALREVLAQLVRNAVVHGIESPDLRRQAGKNEIGTVQVALRRHPERAQLELIVQDDGRGLDLAAIEAKARARGLAIEAGRPLETLIFSPGLSTAAELSLDAGRGIGLDLVRARVADLGGRIGVHHQPGVFCAFQILLPSANSAPSASGAGAGR